ncbi:MAG TPA: VOC family protein [Chthoniobacterales bacterium]
MTLTGINHVAIICSDYLRSREFYTGILGFPVVAETYRADRDSYKLDLALPGGTQIELFSFPDSPPRASYPEARGLRHLALSVRDLDNDIRELESKGISVEAVRVDPVTGRRFTFFADPDGLPIELCEEA